ncbi:MAG: hypothetical protein FGM24_05690 [Candidatus Kapabacteria bacterium]|nr:hypothetical protein [Candidatus Kapabacteria bacterium]
MMPFWVISSRMRRFVLFMALHVTLAACMVAGDLRIVDDVHDGRPVRIVANMLRVRFQSGLAYSTAAAANLLPPGMRVVDQFLAPQRSQWLGNSLSRMGKGAMSDPLLRAEEQLLRTFTVRVDGPVDVWRVASKLASDRSTYETVEPWIVDELHATPNDPYLNDQAYLPVIRAVEAWGVYKGDPSMVVAICDNGIDQSHEDLAGSLFTRTSEIPDNNIDDDGNGYVDDYRGCNLAAAIDGTPGSTSHPDAHGTEVAGIASATWNNGVGIAGIAGTCRMFPLKVSVRGQSGVAFGYLGIMYAAQQGFKVVNCSWGVTKAFSIIDQSVIDYATAKGTLVVASGGNHGTQAGGSPYFRNYPSAYRGVLGVGETTLLDRVTSTSGLGQNIDVFAPAYQAFTTTTFGSYTSFGVQGTSFAAPMVSAAAALVRGKYPSLTPLQTTALIRRTAFGIGTSNPTLQAGLPGRLDVYAALTEDPMGAPGIDLAAHRLLRDGQSLRRIPLSVPLTLQVDLANHLGMANGVVTETRIVALNGWDVDVTSADAAPVTIATSTTASVDAAVLTIRSQGERPLLLAVRVMSEGSYEDEFIVMVDAESNMTTMSNGVLTYSIGDAGALGVVGASDSRLGLGFTWNEGYWLLSPSGLIVAEGETRGLTGMNDIGLTSDFTSVKPFVEPDTNVAVMTDENASDDRRIGVRVRTRATFNRNHPEATVLHLQLTNISGQTLQDVGMGYVLDWDLGSAGANNRSRLAPEAIPETFRAVPVAAQVFYRDVAPTQLAVICGVITAHDGAKPQTAAFPWDTYLGDGLSAGDMVELLRSDASIQTDEIGDLAGVVGMRFPGPLPPDAQRDMLVVIAVAPTTDSAAAIMRNVIMNPMSVEVPTEPSARLLPNPANDATSILHAEGVRRIDLVDARGTVMTSVSPDVASVRTVLPLTAVSSGMYYIVVHGPDGRLTLPLSVIK